MKRHACNARPEWQKIVEEDGFVWHTTNSQSYWLEGAYYSFSSNEIQAIETATTELYDLFVRAGEVLVNDKGDWLERFHIPSLVQNAIRQAWEEEPPALNFGRFDFGLSEDGIPRLFEFNCDTPTSLLEASVIQWRWKEALFPEYDQFNSLHEKLVSKVEIFEEQLRICTPTPFHPCC